MELTEKQLADIKIIELNLLKSFISVCEKLNLRYYIVGGTLLGAVRHKGFIPWDDDIDVGMPREDYEIFIQKGQALLPDGYFIQSYISDPEYPNCFAKLRDSNTTYWETSAKNINMNHGVFIDIFPQDYYPDNKKREKKLVSRRMLLNIRIRSAYNLKMDIKVRLANVLLHLVYPTYRSAVKARERLFKSEPRSSLIVTHGGAWGRKEILQARWCEEITMLEFEDLSVCAPAGYHEMLTNLYGDYMQLPPIEKRCPHHYVEVADFERSYRDYINN